MKAVHQKEGIFYGWWVLIACAIIQLYFSGTFVSGFTALFNPIVDEFGWSYALVSLGFTFRGFEMGLLAPVVGFFVDRYRPRKLLFGGAILGALGFFFFSRIQSLWSFYAAFALLGLSLSLSSQVVIMTAIAGWFKKRTTLAMGIAAAGAGAGGLLVPGVIWFVDTLGWKQALDFFAIGALVICIPLCFIVKDPPPEAPAVQASGASTRPGLMANRIIVKEILKTKNFWLLSVAILLAGSANSAITAHQIPYLVSVGFTRDTAGLMAVALSLSNIAGRIGFGWLGDTMDKRRCFMLASFIQAAGLIVFAYSTSVALVLPALIITGIGLGGFMPLRPALQIEFFGLQAFATIQGLIMVFITVGSMASPPLAGWVFDFFNNYQPAWLALAALAIAAAPVILAASKPGAYAVPHSRDLASAPASVLFRLFNQLNDGVIGGGEKRDIG